MMGAIVGRQTLFYRGSSVTKYYKNYVERPMEEICEVLHMTSPQIKQIFKSFIQFDRDQSGEITLREFYKVMGVRPSRFVERVFGLFDLDRSGELNFQEFFLGVWNLCTMGEHALVRFAFDLIDADKSGVLDMPEVDALVRTLYDMDEITEACQAALNSMDDNNDGKVTLDELIAYNRNFPELLRPAFQLQEQVRAKICTEHFWTAQAGLRKRHHPNKDNVSDILLAKRREKRQEDENDKEEQARKEKEEQDLRSQETAEETANRLRAEALRQAQEKANEAFEETELRESKHEFELASGALAAAMKRQDDEAVLRTGALFAPSLNRYITASLAELEHRKDQERGNAIKNTKHAVDEFFQDPEGLKLLKQRTTEELRRMNQKSFFISSAAKKEARSKAYTKYLQQKVDRAKMESEAKFRQEERKLAEANKELKGAASKQLGHEQRALDSWQWKENFSNIKREYFYTCAATKTTLWEQPFDNLDSACSVCKKVGEATLRCQQCHIEICDECDTVQHWGVVKSAHRRFQITVDELEWRVKKKEFDKRLEKNRASTLLVDL